MKENDYQTLYRLFHAFTACAKKATHRVSGENDVALTTDDRGCYTADGQSLFLCESCLEFWQECRRLRDRSTWETAVFLRRSRVEREYER